MNHFASTNASTVLSIFLLLSSISASVFGMGVGQAGPSGDIDSIKSDSVRGGDAASQTALQAVVKELIASHKELRGVLDRARVCDSGMEASHEVVGALPDEDFSRLVYDTAPAQAKRIVETLKSSAFQKLSKVKAILLAGPSGTGKSTLAKVMAQKSRRSCAENFKGQAKIRGKLSVVSNTFYR